MIEIYTEKANSKDWILQNDLYFNLNTGNEEITQKEIAKELKISRSYVSRIEKRALTKILREFMKNKSVN